ALGERHQRPVLRWSGLVLLGIATAVLVFWQALVANPLFTRVSVSNLVVFDTLSLAYALPAVIYALIARLSSAPSMLRAAARILATSLAFLWLTLEIRHVFRGTVLLWGTSSEAEWYTYSVVWLAFAGAMIGLGLLRRNESLRRAGLTGTGLVIGKVFLSDMAALSGVLRALSFIGLGLALIGLGYAYRRLRPLREQPRT